MHDASVCVQQVAKLYRTPCPVRSDEIPIQEVHAIFLRGSDVIVGFGFSGTARRKEFWFAGA